MRSYNTKNSDNISHFKLNLFLRNCFVFCLAFCSYGIEQAGLKYMQLRKSQYLQEKAFEICALLWNQCFQMS